MTESEIKDVCNSCVGCRRMPLPDKFDRHYRWNLLNRILGSFVHAVLLPEMVCYQGLIGL